MAFTGSVNTSSFKKELGQAIHNIDTAGDVFKIALYTSSATLDATTTVYTTSDEIVGAGYSAGGYTLVNQAATISGTTAIFGWATYVTANLSATVHGALIYNSSKANRSVAVLDFGLDITKSAAPLTITMPTFDVTNALIRIS
jgi:hypothetical protein